MKEHRQIVDLWHQGPASVLATLVRIEGSSYRQPGARLLLAPGNRYAGTISGGCLEADLLRKALWLVRRGAALERYSTLFDDTAEIPFGLGCGGVVHLLLEPAATPECQALVRALEQALSGTEAIVVTRLPGNHQALARAIFSTEGSLVFASSGLTQPELAAMQSFALEDPAVASEEIFVERLVAPQRLVILGAGDDAKPLVSMAALLGWNICVMDGRPQLALPERFPEAQSVSVIREPHADLQHIGPADAVVLMTHSYQQDADLLTALLPLEPAYLGILGARHRTSLLIDGAAAQLGSSVAACCERLHAPIGLNLGGDGPEVIALAVIAEVQASLSGKRSGELSGKLAASRKLSSQDIETYLSQGGSMQYQLPQCALDGA